MRRLLLGLVGALLLSPLAACSAVPRRHRAPRWFYHLSPEPIPETEPFEELLENRAPFIDVLFSIDAMIHKDCDLPRARERYNALLTKIRPQVERALATGGAHGAVLEVMGALRAEGFEYSSEEAGWASRFGPVSECLLARKGLCLSFTLLSMALLDSFGVESRTVCYPKHILLRIRKGEREIDMESTLYGDPVVYPYPPDLPERAAREGFIYGRSLSRTESAWLYLTDLLWAWAPLRSKDFHSFWLLERAEEVLDGSAEVICFQWALRHQLRSVRPAIPASDRAESLSIAVDDYERVIRWEPEQGMPYLLMSVAYEDYGDRSSSLRVLQRYVNFRIAPPTPISTFIEARWWIKRDEFALPEFKADPAERKRGEAFLAEHYPSRDRAAWLEAQVRRWFVPKEP